MSLSPCRTCKFFSRNKLSATGEGTCRVNAPSVFCFPAQGPMGNVAQITFSAWPTVVADGEGCGEHVLAVGIGNGAADDIVESMPTVWTS